MALCWGVAAAVALACAAAGPVVQTKSGPVEGLFDAAANVNIWHSIPFAAPPIGTLRFAAPQPPAAWTDVLDVTALPPACAQTKTNATSYTGSEDCLYIQVYAPANVTGPLPVLHWIYGGGYVIGDSSNPQYIGTDLAAKTGAIVVTHNYRLGPFGFLALPSLRAADPNGSTGNQGLQDQVMALQWVHDNIAAFGGDPSRVTIFGESAGGFSVCWHMVSQTSSGLFASAIMESGTCDAPQFFTPVASAMDFGAIYSSAMGCNGTTSEQTLDCMRSKSTADVLTTIWDVFNPHWPFTSDDATDSVAARAGVDTTNVTPAAFAAQQLGLPAPLRQLPALAPIMPWGPAIDGSRAGLLDLPLRLIEQGKFNRVPMILGTNANEMTVFLPLFPLAVANTTFPPGPTDLGLFIQHGLDMFPSPVVANLTAYVTAFYPVGTDGSDFMRTADALTHMFFTCSARRAARALSQYVPTYLYQFSYALDWLGGLEYWLLGDFHTAELEFVWRDAWPRGSNNFTAADWAVADAFSGYWGNMAHAGSPNAGPLPVPLAWPQYAPASNVNLQIQMPFNTTAHLDKTLCDAWDVVYGALNTVGRVR